jgi:hypothetical protein
VVEGGVEGVFVFRAEQAVHSVGEALVPEVVFSTAAGIGQTIGEPQKLFGVPRQTTPRRPRRLRFIGALLVVEVWTGRARRDRPPGQ